jgi:hypothetical protein
MHMAENQRGEYIVSMMQSTKDLLKRVENWPEQDQQELAEVIRDIEARRTGVYHPTPEELQGIDEALDQVARGEVASAEEIEAAFAKFRRA